MKPLSEQQIAFCYEYIKQGYNATKAYKIIYPNCNCNPNVNRVLKNPKIREKIAEIRKDKMTELMIDADRIDEKLAEIAFSPKGDEYYNAAAQLKALSDLSKRQLFGEEMIIKVGFMGNGD